MPKRILWLFNHTSLRKFEVPMLIDMGYEVYCPKQWNILDFSASVTYKYDESLTIPKHILEKLNKVDFYKSISSDIMDLLNQYFDIAICMLEYNMLKSFAKSFKGAFCIHVFGLEKKMNYTMLLNNGLLSLFSMAGNRFWFLPTYSNITNIECELLKKRSLFTPIGLVNSEIKNSWTGGEKKFLFISPKIKTNEYYANVYREFCQNFGDLPHIIGGAQLQPVPEDKTVTGFLSNEEYEYNMDHLSGMFYHSQEPRHLHYHPLEAIKQGMPLIFMAGGMLDYLGGKELPGRAQTVKEARSKLKRLLNDDKNFIELVKDSQKILLKPFKMSYCKPYWESAMKKIEDSLPKRDDLGCWTPSSKVKRIAIILPASYTGGVLDYSIRLTLNLYHSIKEHGDLAEVIFAYPDDDIYKNGKYFKKLEKHGIKMRSYVYDYKDSIWIQKTVRLAGFEDNYGITMPYSKYTVLRDGIADFQDCDHIILTSDTGPVCYPFFFLKPFSVTVHDYIQRYVPESVSREANKVKLINQRLADNVIVTSKATYNDAIQFANHSSSKVTLTPLLLELLEKPTTLNGSNKNYFLWVTNAAPHKNHMRALRALEYYYQNGGKLDCYITGVNTKYFKPNTDLSSAPVKKEYVEKIQYIIGQSELLQEHLWIKGDLTKVNYIKILDNAKFVFHPGYGDNGTGTVIDAASFGVPSLSSDYPAMRYLAQFIEIPLQYMTPFDPELMGNALMDMGKNYLQYADLIPDREKLRKYEYRNQAEETYKCIKEIVGF